MVLGCYLVVTSTGEHILIDTGIAPEARSTGPSPFGPALTVLDHLQALNIAPTAVKTLVCTHFDVDHAGFHDSFPDAEFIVQRAHYELARTGTPRLDHARAHWDNPRLKYRLIEGDTEILPGLTLIETSGHVTGHQSVLVRLPRTGPVLLAIDAVMVQRLFTPDRAAGPLDENLDQLRASTTKLLDLVRNENVPLVIFGHDGLQWQSLKKSPDFYD
jgi:N-acyl homoserine lactone hydrolase